MNLRNIFILILSTLTTLSNGQLVELQWAVTMGGDKIETVLQTETDFSGNTYVILSSSSNELLTESGQEVSSDLNRSPFLVKYNPFGNISWSISFPPLGNSSSMLAVSDDGSFFIHGDLESSESSTIDFGNGVILEYSGQGIAFVKYSADGKAIFAKFIQSPEIAPRQNRRIISLADGGFLMIGQVYNFNSATVNFGNDVILNIDGNSSARGFTDVFMTKYDENGNAIWVTIYDTGASDNVIKADVDRQNNIYLTTRNDNFPAYKEILKYSTIGQLLWSKEISIADLDLTARPNGGIILSGKVDDEFILGGDTLIESDEDIDLYNEVFCMLHLDGNGEVLFSKILTELDGDDVAIQESKFNSNDDEIVFVLSTVGGYEFDENISIEPETDQTASTIHFLTSYDLNGQLSWVRKIVTNGYVNVRDIAFNIEGGIYIAGDFTPTPDASFFSNMFPDLPESNLRFANGLIPPFRGGDVDVFAAYFDDELLSSGIDVSIAHYHQIQEIFGFQPPFSEFAELKEDEDQLAYSSGDDDVSFKVCADGSKSSIFKIELDNNYSVQDLDIKIKGSEQIEDEEERLSLYGQFENRVISFNNNSLTIKYRHPDHVNFAEEKEVNYIIEVILEGNGVVKEFPLKIFPTPVLMIHSLWSEGGDNFKPLESFLSRKGYLKGFLHIADYQKTDDKSFVENIKDKKVIRTNIDMLIGKVVESKIAAGKVDIIGYGMGGLLTRMYLRREYYRADIHKVITCNTPHYGTQIANMILDERATIFSFSADQFCFHFKDCNDGAVEDIKILRNSDSSIDLLTEEHNTPFHFVGTIGKLPIVKKTVDDIMKEIIFGNNSELPPLRLSPLQIVVYAGLLSILAAADGNFDSVVEVDLPEIASALFSERNDGFIPLSSQIVEQFNPQGIEHITVVSDQIHWKAIKNDTVHNKIHSVLEKSPNSTFFSTERIGYPDPLLEYDLVNIVSEDASVVKNNSSISIYPEGEISAVVGETISLNIETSDENVNRLVIFYESDNQVITYTEDTRSLNYSLIVASTPLGENKFTVYGYDENDNLIAANQKIYSISPNTSPDMIIVDSSLIWMKKLDEVRVKAIGVFGGVEVDISNLDRVKYVFKNGLVEHIGMGYIKANTIGRDSLIIKYGQTSSISIPIKVVGEDRSLSTSVEEKISSNSITTIELSRIYPNPSTSEFIIDLYSPQKQIVSLFITDINGNVILSQKYNAMLGDSRIDFSLDKFSAGTYIVKIVSNDDIEVGKIVKI